MMRGCVKGRRHAIPAKRAREDCDRDAGELKKIMKILKTNSWVVLCAVALLLAGQAAWAQQVAVPARVVEAVDDARTVTLQGNVHPLARAEYDQGPVSDAQPATRMLLLLQRNPDQEASLRQLLDQQQDKTSSNYHAWLTPAQFGTQFGPADADIQAVTGWLQSHGFQNVKVGAGRTTIEFSGNVGQVRNAFHTDIHSFLVHGEQHVANVSDPQIPAALAPVLAGVMGLHNFRPKSQMHRMKNLLSANVTGTGPKPAVTFSCGNGPCYGVAPADFATIYNTTPLLTGSPKIDGTGVPIAIVQDSNINVTDIQQFRTLFGLSSNFGNSNVILNGPDPGVQGPDSVSGDEGEADLDVEWAGAVAPGATIDLVVSQDSATTGAAGVDLSAIYIIDNNIAPILSESFGACEAYLTTAGNQFYYYLWEQAAAQGITVLIAAGDTGSDSCDAGSGYDFGTDQYGFNVTLGVSGLASTPFNVALGGTDFQNGTLPSKYWNTTNGTPPESAISYIPESTWNSGCAATATTGSLATCAAINPSTDNGIDLEGGGGGQSNCATQNSAGTACTAGNAKPSWQNVISSDTYRDIPDVSLYAAVNTPSNTFYLMCEQDSPSQNGSACSLTAAAGQPIPINTVGGTSAAAPAFAGIMALMIQQQSGVRQGNANYVLYQLYKKSTVGTTICTSNAASVSATGCIFYDTVTGNNSVACASGVPNCSNTSTSANQYGVLVDPGNTNNPAFLTTTGYDKATGLGSVNVANLAKGWGTVSFDTTTTTISAPSPSTITHGSTVSFTVNVTSPSGTPTGNVSLIATPSAGSPVAIGAFSDSNVVPPSPTFVLSGGTATITTNMLPGGTDSVVAQYAGDGTFAPGTSTPPVNVTVSPETSKTTISMLTYDTSDGLYDVAAPSSVVYGTTPYIMRVDVTNAANQPCSTSTSTLAIPCPTGTITETYDGGKPLNDFPNTQTGATSNTASLLNSFGFLEDLPIDLPGGSHTIVAAYSGDNSYNASTSSAFSLSVSAATPAATIVSANTLTPTTTTNVTLTATIYTSSSGLGPTGSVTFTASGPGGTTTLGTISGSNLISTAASGLNTNAPIPAYATANLKYTFATAGTYTISATYSGDVNYTTSSSASTGGNLSLPVTQSTGPGSFTLAGGPATVTAGSSGNSTITLTPTGGFTSSGVAITCGTALPGVTCGALNITVPSGGGNGTGTLIVNVAANSSTMTAMNLPETQKLRAAIFPAAPSLRGGWWTLSGGTGLAAILLLLVPGRKRYSAVLGLALLCVLSFTLGCGGGSSGGGGGGGTTPTVTHLTVSSTKLVAAATTSITVSATVTGGTPTGTVDFLVDGAILGTATVANGTTGPITVTGAQAPPFLELVGTHTVSASYLGDSTTAPSASGTLYVTLTGTAQLPIAANPAASNPNQTINLTVN